MELNDERQMELSVRSPIIHISVLEDKNQLSSWQRQSLACHRLPGNEWYSPQRRLRYCIQPVTPETILNSLVLT